MSFGVQFSEEAIKQETGFEEAQNPKEEVQPQETKGTVEEVATKPTIEKETKTDIELNDDLVLDYFKKQGKEVNSLNDLFKTPETKEVEKVVEKNPYADVFDDYDTKYFEFKRETGLGRKEFDFVQQDFSKKSEIDLAIEKVKKDAGGNITDAEVKEYLDSKFEIDFETGELSAKNKIELASFVKPYKEELQKLQEKYKATVAEKKPTTPSNVEMVELDNGEKVPKAQYEQFLETRNAYLTDLKKGVSGATSFEVSTTFDNNGEKQPVTFSYEFSDEDRHSMLSDASDLDAFVGKMFKSEKGFDHKGLATFLDKAKNFDKYVGLAMQQARAEAIEEMIANGNNENFNRKPLQKQEANKEGYSSLTGNTSKSGFGVAVDFSSVTK